ncbi:MAG: type I restriction endonuclease subunit R [Desulfobacula sp.]|jgi:type I restriction enzyme, R subunit|uniref:type I restriction endonuclease subunit R n=1 Tax=Desulfobacula sp. TaxID=2593537 RepID=UPI001D2A538A|nr:type I restriction endonuclease subunit R [Desulfobacula sp.]MBT3487762.1 type I restriction endonuclease subunit R [Desulfobacula sp.]MBT3805699.1 type I restriction endonuclease subunit R [Desulfobacula sp.]MBT4023873.1 type I restriction endonuclease subunit R [Desulfobacula sp.]MBT4199001.1 type I restriction endonuclease subunit R [Desulfobacula sp.]
MSEYTEVEQPFLHQLESLGWAAIDQGSDIPHDPNKSLRQTFRQWLLPDVFAKAVTAINKTAAGETWLTDKQLNDLQDQIHRQPNRTLLEANEAIQKLMFKTQVDVNELTGEQDPIVKLIDFDTPENNQFHVINQFRIDTPGSVKQFIIPDIVLFVNGIPLAVVECKKGGPTCANPMIEAFEQLQRYMNKRPATQSQGLREGEPKLFHTALLLIRSCGLEADFGTLTSGEEHFFPWKTQWPDEDAVAVGMNQQQQMIAGLLNKQNLLQILRTASVFMDTGSGPRIKVVCRYQQFRAANKICEQLRNGKTTAQRSGVVWHTQGSGKSLTMVFVARMIRVSKDLNDYKIVLINDRIDLEDQLSKTATLIGGRVNIVQNTTALRADLGWDTSDINMVMAHKFQQREQSLSLQVAEALGTYQAMPSGKTFGVVNTSDRILLMIDEAHRTQGSDLGDNIFEAFPNAARIAFTGTPLIMERHGEKKTHKRFGQYIDTYRLMDAVNDKATLQILYEGKTADAALTDKHGFETAFEDMFKDRTEEEVLAIKKKYGTAGDILEAEQRIKAIAKDMVDHYIHNILPNGFKAQVVCHSKLAVIRYQTAIQDVLKEKLEQEKAKAQPDLNLIKKISFLKAAVVVSSDGTNEAAYITESRKQTKIWDAKRNFCKPFDFDDPDKEYTGIAFLIICDMLLTGFDAPIEQVMYIDKKIREHTLLQAIARTNRVAKGKKRGYVVDYIGLSNHLTEALTLYAATDEQEELAQGLKSITSEMPVLEERYQRLLQLFSNNKVAHVAEFVQGKLPDMAADALVVHKAVTLLKDEKLRADFDVYLKKFLMSMDIILPHQAANPYRVPAKRFGYILRVTKERYKDTSLNLRDAGEKVKELINAHLISLGINPKVPPIELLSEDFLENLNKHAGGNLEAKASEMEHAIRKHCTVHHDEDPAFYKSLSEKVENLIDQYQGHWNLLVDELEKLRNEAIEGRKIGKNGMTKEATIFFEHIVSETFANTKMTNETKSKMQVLMEAIVDTLQDSIGSIDFWTNADKQKKARSNIKTALMLTDIAELKENRERVAIEIMKLAKNRHDDLLKGNNK